MLMNIRFFTLLSLVITGLGLAACETMEGAGRDIEHAGESVQDAAD
jgi:entericidin B